jgi:hypothetical protein
MLTSEVLYQLSYVGGCGQCTADPPRAWVIPSARVTSNDGFPERLPACGKTCGKITPVRPRRPRPRRR